MVLSPNAILPAFKNPGLPRIQAAHHTLQHKKQKGLYNTNKQWQVIAKSKQQCIKSSYSPRQEVFLHTIKQTFKRSIRIQDAKKQTNKLGNTLKQKLLNQDISA